MPKRHQDEVDGREDGCTPVASRGKAGVERRRAVEVTVPVTWLRHGPGARFAAVWAPTLASLFSLLSSLVFFFFSFSSPSSLLLFLEFVGEMFNILSSMLYYDP